VRSPFYFAATHEFELGAHTWPAGHEPQSSVAPHPSETVPQLAPRASHVFGVQPQWFGTPLPPHVVGGAQSPHSMMFAHPSFAFPHSAANLAHVRGSHTSPSSEQVVGPMPTQTDTS
jgi:hypothetical protein